MLKSYGMCHFLPPPGRHQKSTGNLRYLVFFEIRKKIEKDAKHENIKIIKDVSLFAASGTATKSDRESPVPRVFWNSQKMKKIEKNKNIKNIKDVSLFAASGTATIWVTESPLPSFFNLKILRKIKNYDFQKS